MISNYELKLRARASLGGSIFGDLWLMALLALVVVSAVSGLAATTVVGSILVIGPLGLGSAAIFLGLARGRGAVDLADLFKGFLTNFTDNLLLGLVSSLKIFLWSLLFVIPGLVKAYAYAMIYYIKLDHPAYTWRECLAASERMMAGKKWRLFCLDLSFLGWIIVGSLCLGIGLLWVAPYMQAARAQFYEVAK